jgi:hypothetical protein
VMALCQDYAFEKDFKPNGHFDGFLLPLNPV